MQIADFKLQPYALETAEPDLQISLRVSREADELRFRFDFIGSAVARLVWPKHARAPERRDELWTTTVVELFVSTSDQAYCEMNLAPSGDWNVYALDSYRAGLRPAAGFQMTPLTGVAKSNAHAEIAGALPLAPLKVTGELTFGATAVLEYVNGKKEYWALAHKGEKPDFHLRSSFVGRV